MLKAVIATDDSSKETEALRARGKATAGAEFGEPGVGAGFCARCGGVGTGDPGAECGRCLYARVSGFGSDTSFASRRVTRVLDAIIAERGIAGAIRVDNGPEFTSRHFLAWCVERQIELIHIQPGKPTQNGRIESFHGRLREECLRVSWFQNLFDARRKLAAWRIEYNEERPHSSLSYRTPKEFAVAQAAGFYTAEREARDSNAVPRPSRSPIPARTGDGEKKLSRSYVIGNWGQITAAIGKERGLCSCQIGTHF
jgi:hypothetical protein